MTSPDSMRSGTRKRQGRSVDKSEILAQLKRLLNEQFEIDPASIDGSTRQSDLGIDSILMVGLMLDIESTLGFSFDMMDLPKNPSLNEISDLVYRNLNR